MSDFDTATNAVRLAIATAEALSGALDKAKQALDSSTDQLKTVLADIEKDRETEHEALASDREEARGDLDNKFDGSKDDD
jgi:septal ring factor EnvC (AmiA/AmiB activator)